MNMKEFNQENGGTTERTYVLIHTDDIDGITRNPAHGVAIKDAFDKRFGVKVVDPRFMLGTSCSEVQQMWWQQTWMV